MTRYRLAPLFAVRSAGVAFDVLEQLGTPAVAASGRVLLGLEHEVEILAREVLDLGGALAESRADRERLKSRIKRRLDLTTEALAGRPWLARYDQAVRRASAAAAELTAEIEREYRRLHGELIGAARRELPDFLVFESDAMAIEIERLASAVGDGATEHLSRDRQKYRSLALYLQRVCAKNDTVSRFGPASWGTVVPGTGARIDLEPEISRRQVEVERWVVKALVDVLNADPEVRAETSPRLHPHGLLTPDGFVRDDQDRTIPLSAEQRAIAGRCDGASPAYQIGDLATLATLAELGVIRWELELRARDVAFLSTLLEDVSRWRPGSSRDHWIAALEGIAELASRFATDLSTAGRRAIINELHARLASLGVGRRTPDRMLYAAHNPINENCLQAGRLELGARTVESMLAQAAPWFDLYRDAAAFASLQVFHRLREIIIAAPRRNGRLSYAVLAREAMRQGASITDDTLHEQVATSAFAEVKRDLAALLGRRPDAPEWQLTAEECTFLRRCHALPAFTEVTYPSADLQISAASAEDAEAGRFEWLIAELHHGLIHVQHATYWSCPDKPALHAAIAEVVDHQPSLARDAGNYTPVHGSFEAAMWALPRITYVGVGCPKTGWRVRAPADTEVILDEQHCDVRLHARGEDLGSLIRTPRLLAGMHPFFPFERGPHAPRLRLGEVIVQRRSWHLDSLELRPQRANGVSAEFVTAIERARSDRGIPRWVFVRPLPGVLATGPLTRDKDNKPIYIDLESVVFLDILERRLRKYKTLVVTEMLPTPDHLFARVAGGKRSFELRTNILPCKPV